ncbi:MAG TPA: OmpH family outer membrane protein [Steroidobacteraceae bacterium]|jgi:Skp family chaperone for outer membrane proteins
MSSILGWSSILGSRCVLCLVLAVSGAAMAAAPATPPASSPASPEGLGGPAIPGACLLSRDAVFINAKVGQAASARLKQLTEAAQAEVNDERKPIDTELASLRAATKLSADERHTREQALSKQLEALQVKATQRSREIEATRIKALERIGVAAQPVIAEVYKKQHCGLLIDRNVVLGGNLSNDLTAQVVHGLDAVITTITFDRESLPAAPSAAPRQ